MKVNFKKSAGKGEGEKIGPDRKKEGETCGGRRRGVVVIVYMGPPRPW